MPKGPEKNPMCTFGDDKPQRLICSSGNFPTGEVGGLSAPSVLKRHLIEFSEVSKPRQEAESPRRLTGSEAEGDLQVTLMGNE